MPLPKIYPMYEYIHVYTHKAVYIADDAEQYKSLTNVFKQNIRMKYKIMSDLQLIKRRNNLREHYCLQYIT